MFCVSLTELTNTRAHLTLHFVRHYMSHKEFIVGQFLSVIVSYHFYFIDSYHGA